MLTMCKLVLNFIVWSSLYYTVIMVDIHVQKFIVVLIILLTGNDACSILLLFVIKIVPT